MIFNTFSDAITYMNNNSWEYFTIGNGKKPYHFYTCGSCGCYYVYRCLPDGHAGARRQIENNTKIKII